MAWPKPDRGTIPPLLVLSIVALLLNPALMAPAFAAPCTGVAFLFDGTNVRNLDRDGIQAVITPYTPALCNGSWSLSAVWVMLQAQGSDPNQYAQSGYLRRPGQTVVHRFAEYSKNQNTSPVDWEGGTPGSDNYKVQYNYSLNRMEMFVAGSLRLSTNFDPATAWSGNWAPEWEGETGDSGDNIPGVATDRVHFATMQVKNCNGCSYHAPSGYSLSSDKPFYCFTWVSDQTEFEVWTHRASC